MLVTNTFIIIIFCLLGNFESTSATEFNKDFMVVQFDPYVSFEDVTITSYDELELIPLLAKLSAKFLRIYVKIPNKLDEHTQSSLALVPTSVARLNRAKTRIEFPRSAEPDDCSIEAWLIYHYNNEDVNKETLSGLKAIKRLADKANMIFPGTVSTILLDYFGERDERSDGDQFESLLVNARDIFTMSTNNHSEAAWNTVLSRSSYKLGIIIPTSDRSILPISSEVMSRLLDKVDFAICSSFPNPDLEVISVPSSLLKCNRTIHSLNSAKGTPRNPKKVEVVFSTGYSDTAVTGITNYTNLVKYWEAMNALSKSFNVTVMMAKAFDTPKESIRAGQTSGWWRLIENSSYRNTSDYVFKEKTTSAREEQMTSKDNERMISWLRRDTTFSREHTGVWFEPFLTKQNVLRPDSFSELDLSRLVAKIETKFSRIMIPHLNLKVSDVTLTSVHLIPRAVARFNLNRTELRLDGPVKDISFRPVELIMTFDGENVHFDTAIEEAVAANHIYPNTVKSLVLHPSTSVWLQSAWIKRAKQVLAYAGQGSQGKYKIGVVILINSCTGRVKESPFSQEIAPLLQLVQHLYFQAPITRKVKALGVDRLYSQMVTRFENCQAKIASAVEHKLDVSFITEWSDMTPAGQSDYISMVRYWRKMNEWGARTNTTVIFMEAFDNARKRGHGHSGWWTRRGSQEINDYIFKDKQKIALEMLNNPEKWEQDGKGTIHSDMALSTTSIVLIVVAVTAIGTVLIMLVLRQLKQRYNYLSKDEIHDFFKGGRGGTNPDLCIGNCSYTTAAYGKGLYEVKKNEFEIDEESVLGCGEFGKVCRAKSIKRDKTATQPTRVVEVAVKMTNISCPKSAFKGILSEIKILSYLGPHENIVGLIGAHTSDLQKGKVLLFLELCDLGSLEKYLREVKPSLLMANDVPDEEEDIYSNRYLITQKVSTNVDPFLVKDMHRWSLEVAKGMEFVTSKNVIHADLATRNVLLTADKRAKISDFGLSRRLYYYTNYVKTQHEPLPWRWMAPECLKRLEFNEKTDVWAFGVMLWEIYSFADIPYPGLSWDINFPQTLEKGLRLSEPMHCQQGMYSNMLRCWNVDPSKRPTFTQLSGILSKFSITQ